MEFIHNKQATRYGPTKVLATNRTLNNLVDVFAKKKDISINQVYGATMRTRIFEAELVPVFVSEVQSIPDKMEIL